MEPVRPRLLAALLGCAVLALSAHAQSLPPGITRVTSVEGINEYRLANGLRVLLFPDPTKTNITVNITYMVGSRHEDYGESGMAHLLEHLLFMGSKNHPDIKKELTDRGTRPNGSTWYDRTNYFETFTATEDNLRWALDLEADRMVNSFVSRKDLDSEMTVVRNEFEAGENSPNRVLFERVLSTAYLWHNYGKSTIGSRSDIENVPIERLQAFYRHFYQPDNALLVVAGKFEEAKALSYIHQFFGPIPKPSRELRRTYTVEPVQDGERLVTLRRVGDVQALAMAYHVPAGSHEEFAAVEMAADILGDVPSGRLYKALVETKKAVSVSFNTFQLKDPGVAVLSASVRQENSLDEVRKIATDLLDNLANTPFTQEELDRAKTASLKQIELLFNDSQRVALLLSEWQAMGDWRLIFLHRDRIKKTTLAQVQQAANKYFIPSNRTVGLFIPDKAPLRAEIPPAPDVEALVKDYKSDVVITQGEEFDASPANINRRLARGSMGAVQLSLLEKKTRGNQVIAQITFRHGDEKSLAGQNQVASFTGAMLLRGTTRRSRQEIKDEFDKLKANVMVTGGLETANARITTTRENLPAVLDLVAEVLKQPSFPAQEFEQLKQQQLASIERMRSEPQMIAMQAMQRHLSPYPKGDVRYVPALDEQIESIQSVTLDQVKEFHKQFYGASAGEIVLVGDFDREATQNQLRRLFADWKTARPYVRISRPYKAVEPKAETFETPDKTNSLWLAALTLQMRDTSPDYPAMLLANYIFGGSGLNSKLFARIRTKEGLSYGVGSMFSSGAKDDNSLWLANAIANPANAPKVEAVFREELAKALAQPFSAEEVEAAKKSWAQQQQVSRANDTQLVSILAARSFDGRTMDWDAELEARVMQVTPGQLNAAMKKYLDPSRLSFFRAGDFQKAQVKF
jgi:zinc protease